VPCAGKSIPAAHTTPSAIDLQRFFKGMVTRGIRSVVMEVSSHAIMQERVYGIDFQWLIFTNLSREHLDYHKTMHDYFSAKASLFKNATPRATAVINIDDAYGKRLARRLPCRIRTFSLRDPCADVRLEVRTMSTRGSTFTVYSRRGTMSLDTPLFGTHNIYNLAAAITWALYAGIPPVAIKEALDLFKGPPGRLEHIYSRRGCEVFVDYAHTHESLRCALRSLKQVYRGKPLIVVFGCGGSRDKTKRPRMGLVASRLADYVFITNDNPRGEDPRLIARQIMRGFIKNFTRYRCVLDRKKAIHEALRKGRMTKAVVLIAGKGHEKEQIFKDKTIAFCDKQTALGFLA
jgi:UDP-N-acetylmuramoyl-L-alanyl-D-glutamate--2,6-diaminopimelate ligase